MNSILMIILFFLSAPWCRAGIEFDCGTATSGEATKLVDPPKWSFEDTAKVHSYRAEDFLPDAYLANLNAAGLTPKLEITLKPEYRSGSFKITADSNLIASFDFQIGYVQTTLELKNLELGNPLTEKGLPAEVMFHLRDEAYRFLEAGGFKNFEVAGSDSFIAQALYNRFLRGELSSGGKGFTSYLSRLYKLSSTTFPATLRIKSVADFSSKIGNRNNSPLEIMDHFPNGRALSEAQIMFNQQRTGIKLLRDPDSGDLVAAVTDKEVLFFYYKEANGYRPLFWKDIYVRHPEWMRLTGRIQ